MPLPTLNDAIEHLRQDEGIDDVKIEMCLNAAIDMARNFLDRELPWTNDCESSSSDNVEPIPDAVNHAILMITEALYDNRSAGNGDILRPWSTEWMLLYPYRRVGL